MELYSESDYVVEGFQGLRETGDLDVLFVMVGKDRERGKQPVSRNHLDRDGGKVDLRPRRILNRVRSERIHSTDSWVPFPLRVFLHHTPGDRFSRLQTGTKFPNKLIQNDGVKGNKTG